jgi:FixJ family two-component response regulator
MTGLAGLDLLAELSTRRNPPPVLVITACEDAAAVRAARLLGARAVIDEPFSLNALQTAIADALQPPRQLQAAA